MVKSALAQTWSKVHADGTQMVEKGLILTFTHDGFDNYVLGEKARGWRK